MNKKLNTVSKACLFLEQPKKYIRIFLQHIFEKQTNIRHSVEFFLSFFIRSRLGDRRKTNSIIFPCSLFYSSFPTAVFTSKSTSADNVYQINKTKLKSGFSVFQIQKTFFSLDNVYKQFLL